MKFSFLVIERAQRPRSLVGGRLLGIREGVGGDILVGGVVAIKQPGGLERQGLRGCQSLDKGDERLACINLSLAG